MTSRVLGALVGLLVIVGLLVVLVGGGEEEPASSEPRPPAEASQGSAAVEGAAAEAAAPFRRVAGATTAIDWSDGDIGAEGLGRWRDEVPGSRDVRIRSTADGSRQPALWTPPRPGSDEDVPLVVILHSWSSGYRQHIGIPTARWARQAGWASIAPDFRGANAGAETTGSDLAVQDVVDAIDYAIEQGGVDRERVFLTGFSGGGMMSLLVAGRHPDRIAGVASAAPVHDLVDWHDDNRDEPSGAAYAEVMETACGGDPQSEDAAREACERRSPSRYLADLREARVPVHIAHGLDDEIVLPSAGARAFDQLADPADRLGRSVVDELDDGERPDALRRTGTWTGFDDRDPEVLHARRSGRTTFVLFDGEHDVVFHPSLRWMSRVAAGDAPGG